MKSTSFELTGKEGTPSWNKRGVTRGFLFKEGWSRKDMVRFYTPTQWQNL